MDLLSVADDRDCRGCTYERYGKQHNPKIGDEVADKQPVVENSAIDALFCFDQGAPIIGHIRAALEDLQKEEDDRPGDHNDRGDVCHDIETRVGGCFDKDTTVEVDDTEFDEAIGRHHDHVDDELNLVRGLVSNWPAALKRTFWSSMSYLLHEFLLWRSLIQLSILGCVWIRFGRVSDDTPANA